MMRRTRGKVAKLEKEVKNGGGGEDREEISLISWLNLYQGFIGDTADLLKDEISNIKARKITRNEVILKNEKKPEAVRLGKSIVTGFNDAISKAVKDLQNYGTQMSEELQKRFNLPDEWMQSTSTTVSVSGSEINGPTGRQRKEMENRLGFLLRKDGSSSDKSDSNGDGGNQKEKESKGPAEILQENEKDDDNSNSGDTFVAASVSDDDDQADKIDESESKKDSAESKKKAKTAKEVTPKKSTPQKASTPPPEQQEEVNKSDEEVDMIPGSEEEDNVEEEKSDDGEDKQAEVQVPSTSRSTRSSPRIKKEKCTEHETPKKSTQESSDSSKKREASKRNLSAKTVESSDPDSDASGATCIVPTKKNPSPMKPAGPASTKKGRKSEAKSNEKLQNSTEEESESTPQKKPTKDIVNVKKEPQQDHEIEPDDVEDIAMDTGDGESQEAEVANELNVSNTEEADDHIMDFISPVSTPAPAATLTNDDFGMDLDDTMTVVVPRTPIKTGSTATASVASEKKEEQTVSKEEPAEKKEEDEPCEPSTSDKASKPREASKKKSKEELEAMRELLASSNSESEPSKSKKERKHVAKREKKVKRDRDSSTSSRQATGKSWENDPKLTTCPAKIELEKLSPAVEKSLAEKGYVVLKGYSRMKKCNLNQLVKSDGSASDSDSSSASNDSLHELEKQLKKLTRNSIISTKKYDKKKRESESKLEKKTRRTRRRAKGTDENELGSSDSDASNDYDEKKLNGKSENLFSNDIVSCSGSEDIDADSDDSTSKKKKSSRSNPSRNPDRKAKKYVKATITDSESDSEKQNMKAVLGSDTDSEKKTKRSARAKKVVNSSDSDSDFVTKTKRAPKKKRSGSDSDISLLSIKSESSDSDSDSDFKTKKSSKRRRDSSTETKKRKKRRKRIVANDSDDSDKKGSDSDIEEIPQDDDDPGSSQKGRKKIRKIMSNKELAKTTKEAEREEEERRKRLSEKQSLFNGIHKAPESDKLERLVLDVDPDTKEPLVEVDQSIVTHLKPHQAEGIKFMYNACFESVEMIKQNKVPGGCILAHCMGLGKTLQSIAFVHTLLTNELCGIKTALIICPLSTVNNWFKEFRNWTEDAPALKIHKLYEAKNTVASRIDYLKTWQRRGGVGLLHYDIFRRLADPKGKTKMKGNLKKVIQETLLDPGPDIVICDEGHLLKNCKSMLSLAVSMIRTHRRIVLTGTPLQNNLVEYHTMMNFVKPNLLGSLPEFTNRFVNPIKNGQHADSTEYDVKTMKRRSHVLHRKLEGCVQRCDYSILAPYLPPKYEYIIKIKLSEKQEKLYKHYLENVVDSDFVARRRNLLKYYAELVKIWSHPIALTMRKSNKDSEDESEDSSSSLKDFIVDGTSTSESGDESDSDKKSKKRKTRAQAAKDPDTEKPITLDEALQGNGWWNAVYKSKSELEDCSISGKLVILQEILKTSEGIGDKVLVFSQYLSSLDIIEEFLEDWDKESERQQKEKDEPIAFPLTAGPQLGRWRRNIEYFRIDGQTKVQDRHRDCETFNKKSSLSRAKLFLISTRAGGLGINLFGANRVVIFDASWNPSQDMQSIFRVYRFGQDKPCYIYRLIAQGTMEEKILRRQITKLSLASRVVDEHQIERHFKFDDVNEMYQYDEEDPAAKDIVLAVPKDRLLADLLMSHRDWIRAYDEFDSLLENKPDEGLSNEEKELAWEEYRIESDRQRQFSNSNTSAANEAATFLKVKTRLIGNHPYATADQIEEGTRSALEVIEKIRRLMLIQNSGGNVEHLLNPLKQWLQIAVSPQEPSVADPSGARILPALPAAFYETMVGPQYLPRQPPSFVGRPRLPLQYGAAGPPPGLHNIQNMSHNFRNIASNTLAGMRQLAQQQMQMNMMNGHYRPQ